MSERPDISVVIVNHNAVGQLRQCLASIEAHSGGMSVETIVVDNASSDGSIEMARAHFPDVLVIANEDNVGYTRANNTGIEAAGGRFIVLLNNDTEILEGAFERMLRFAEEHPRAGAVAPQLLNADLTMQGNVKRFPTAAAGLFGRKSLLTRLFPRNRFSRRYLLYLEHDMTAPFGVDFASTACLMVRREAIEQAGAFDTDFFCYWSDADLCHRLKDAGWWIMCEPAARVVHYEGMGGTRSARPWRSIVDFNRGAYRYYVKDRLRVPWSPMRLVALAGLSMNAVRQLVEDRWQVLVSSRVGPRLNPAEVPSADRAIKGLAATALMLVVAVAVLQAQYASGGAAIAGKRGGEEPYLAFPDAPTLAADIEWLEEEASRTPEVAPVILPKGASAPSSRPATATASAFAGPPGKPALARVRLPEPDGHSYGLVTYMLDPSEPILDAKIALLAGLGVDTVRMDFRWTLIEPENDEWDLEAFDTAVDKLDAAGLDIVAVTGFTPGWASSAPPGKTVEEVNNYPPASLDEYAEFVSMLATRYRGRVAYWQLGIEPDLNLFWQPAPDPAAFVRQIARGAAAVRAADPAAKVVYPGITTAGKLRFLEDTLKLGVADSVDVFAIHDYDDAPEGKIREDSAYLESLVERYSSAPKECWCTEIGWSTYERPDDVEDPFIDGVTEDEQRDKLLKRWILMRATGLSRTYSWELSDAGVDPHMLLWHLGLVRNDLTPKPAYLAALQVMPLIDGGTSAAAFPVVVPGAPETLETHSFVTEDGRLVVAVWDRAGKEGAFDVVVGSDDFGAPVCLDPGGGPPVPVIHRRLEGAVRLETLAVGDVPAIVVFGRPGLYADPCSISPDGDGRAESTRVSYSVGTPGDWVLEALGAGGTVVKTLAAGSEPGTGSVVWTGLADDGTLVPDGTYTLRLTSAGGEEENLLSVDRAAPSVTGVSSEAKVRMPGDARPYVLLPLGYRLSEPAHVTVDVFDASGRFYLRLRSQRMQTAGAASLDWPIPAEGHPDGWYWYRVTATDAAGNVSSADSARPLHVDFTGPRIGGLGVTPESFSPDADGTGDEVALRYSLSEQADVIASVRDRRGRKYYLYAARSQAAGRYEHVWDGRAYDPSARRLVGMPDGDYVLELAAFDELGNASAATATVRIEGGDFSAPSIAGLSVSPATIVGQPGGPKAVGSVAFALGEHADVLLTVTGAGGKRYPLAALARLAPGRHHLDWNGAVPGADGGRAFLPTGDYVVEAKATDRSGNVAEARTRVRVVSGDHTPPGIGFARVSPPEVSPNGDGIADAAVVSFGVSETADVIVFVRDRAGRRFDIFAGPALRPGRHSFAWRGSGHDGERGEQVALPDGSYALFVEATDRAGNVRRRSGTVRLRGRGASTLAVTGVRAERVPRGYPPGDERDAAIRFTYTLTRRADVTVAVRSLSGRHYYVAALAGEMPGTHSLDWDGTAYDPRTGTRCVVGDGTYVFLIEAVSGSSPGVTSSGRVSVDLRSPR